MAKDSLIEWCRHTFNGWIGCTALSPACDHCYAQALAERFKWAKWGAAEPRHRTSEATWRQPLAWNRAAQQAGERHRVFANSLSDVADAEVPIEWFVDLMELIGQTPHLDWMLLTKRPKVLQARLEDPASRAAYLHGRRKAGMPSLDSWRFPNIWVGTTAEDQKMADLRIPQLLAIDAVCHFVSGEPLLGPLDIARWLYPTHWHWDAKYKTPEEALAAGAYAERKPQGLVSARARFLKLVIAGGESGQGARPILLDAARSLRDQCAAARTAFFFKQWGEYLPVGQVLPGFGKILGGTAAKPGRMKLHYAGAPKHPPTHAFAEHGVKALSTADGRLTFRVGKKAAGRLLDGREHNAMPEVKP